MSTNLIALLISVASMAFAVLWSMFGKGRDVGKFEQKVENLKTDLDELRQGIGVANDLQNEFYREYMKFRLRIAAKLGINGDH